MRMGICAFSSGSRYDHVRFAAETEFYSNRVVFCAFFKSSLNVDGNNNNLICTYKFALF
jgi:hypothetical protein